VGAASGFLTFHMERQGAEVVSFDLSEEYPWDFVPFADVDPQAALVDYRTSMRRINNAYWHCHRAFGSRARVVYGTVYCIPAEIGPVDVSVFGSILLHLRDPFLALQNALRLTRETVIVTDMLSRKHFLQMLLRFPGLARMTFLPHQRGHRHAGTWWALSPALIKRFLGILGFEATRVSFHRQLFRGHTRLLFTVVGRRTKGAALSSYPGEATAAA
jgi:hypothetical protein